MKTSLPTYIVFPTASVASGRRQHANGEITQVRRFRKETPGVRSDFARLLESM